MTSKTIERGRITARVPQPVANELEEAAALVGVTLNQFLVQAAVERARVVIEDFTRISLSRRDAALIIDLLDRPPAAVPALQRAAQRHKDAVVSNEKENRTASAGGKARPRVLRMRAVRAR